MNGRERVFAMLRGEPVDRLPLMPITMMFAGDQIGRKYRDYALDYRVMAEGQMRTAEAFGFDYVSGISDPAREAADCGAAIRLFENQPPAIDEENALLAEKTRLATLAQPDPLGGGRMHDRVKAVAELRRQAGPDLIVEGWVEGPCAQGADLRGINSLMLDFFDDPGFVRDLFSFVIDLEFAFAKAQVQAGADVIGVGDAAASLVGPELYREFVWPFEQQLVGRIHSLGKPVRLHICGNTADLLSEIGRLRCEIVDLDFMVPLRQAREAMGASQILLGNVDPVRVMLRSTPGAIEQALAQCHAEAGPRWIVGAGCEIPRETPRENLLAMTRFAHTRQP
jgi:MtaA/CmuA family methyltransferase